MERINPPELNKPLGPYCQVTRATNMVFLSGMVPINCEGEIVGKGDIKVQARQVMDNMKFALKAVGATFDHIVKTTIFIARIEDFKVMNVVYSSYFSNGVPARSTVRSDLVLEEMLLEIEAIALIE